MNNATYPCQLHSGPITLFFKAFEFETKKTHTTSLTKTTSSCAVTSLATSRARRGNAPRAPQPPPCACLSSPPTSHVYADTARAAQGCRCQRQVTAAYPAPRYLAEAL